MIAGQPKLAVVGHDAGQFLKGGPRNKPPPMMTFLRPRIGKQHKDFVDHRIGQHRQQQSRVFVIKADIFQAFFVNAAQQSGNAVDESLATDKPRTPGFCRACSCQSVHRRRNRPQARRPRPDSANAAVRSSGAPPGSGVQPQACGNRVSIRAWRRGRSFLPRRRPYKRCVVSGFLFVNWLRRPTSEHPQDRCVPRKTRHPHPADGRNDHRPPCGRKWACLGPDARGCHAATDQPFPEVRWTALSSSTFPVSCMLI